ncbi:acyltransferase [Burkholderia sp. Nafp2/4-1b]|uniref:acyltransferase family protein n=1 Tax=Burkholderia sp. Nafp2/4-1b TaxID=2116686 RepID=UPI000EF8AD7E|nr:acyltransferase [Burkholderia sp. Nafp2/4-1b]RKU04546.1 acyltransferase [Burkholderia sp. Nafp2/4-1b]
MTARKISLDVARGAGIILVVYGHVLRGVVSADLVPAGAADAVLAWNDYVIYTFHMPLFFFLSGLHVCSSLRRAPQGFLWSKLRTIAYPYLVWSIAQGAMQIAMASHGTNHPFTLNDLLAIGWRPFAQFWFLYALMLCMIGIRAFATAMPGLTRAPMPARAAGWLAGCAALGLLLGAATRWGILSITLMNAPFFVAGVLAAHALPGWLERHCGPTACAATATAFVAAVVVAHDHGSATSIWALPAAFAGIALALQLAHRYASQPARAGWLAAIGCASMPIYLTHIFAMAAVRIVLMRAGITSVAVHLVLGTLAGVAIPMVVYRGALRTGLARVAGFPSWPGHDTAVRTRTA